MFRETRNIHYCRSLSRGRLRGNAVRVDAKHHGSRIYDNGSDRIQHLYLEKRLIRFSSCFWSPMFWEDKALEEEELCILLNKTKEFLLVFNLLVLPNTSNHLFTSSLMCSYGTPRSAAWSCKYCRPVIKSLNPLICGQYPIIPRNLTIFFIKEIRS